MTSETRPDLEPGLWDIAEARRLRDEGMTLAEWSQKQWRDAAHTWIERLDVGQTFTANDLRVACGEPVNPLGIGGVIMSAARSGWIERHGITANPRREAHARPLTVWERVS